MSAVRPRDTASPTRRPLAWGLGLSLAVHALALLWPVAARQPLRQAARAPALEARLLPPTAPRAAPAPPQVLKNTLDPPQAQQLEDPIKPQPRRRVSEVPTPHVREKTAPLRVNEVPAPPPRTGEGTPERAEPRLPPPVSTPESSAPLRMPGGLDLRLPPRERGERGAPERLSPEQLRETLGRLSEEMLYPADALRRGLEGEVVLMVELGEGGRIRDASIASGSGHASLDAAAVRAVRKLGTLGAATANRTILLPVRFRIM